MAEWSHVYTGSLHDSATAHIEPGGKKGTGARRCAGSGVLLSTGAAPGLRYDSVRFSICVPFGVEGSAVSARTPWRGSYRHGIFRTIEGQNTPAFPLTDHKSPRYISVSSRIAPGSEHMVGADTGDLGILPYYGEIWRAFLVGRSSGASVPPPTYPPLLSWRNRDKRPILCDRTVRDLRYAKAQ